MVVDHVTIYRWLNRLRPSSSLQGDLANRRVEIGGSSMMIYVKFVGQWTHLYRVIDQHGQVIDVVVLGHRDSAAARALFTRALNVGLSPGAGHNRPRTGLPRIDEFAPGPRQVLQQYATTSSELITAG